MVVDISDVLEKKLAAIACYESQFPPAKAGHIEALQPTPASRARGRLRGRRIPGQPWDLGNTGPDGAVVLVRRRAEGGERSAMAPATQSRGFANP